MDFPLEKLDLARILYPIAEVLAGAEYLFLPYCAGEGSGDPRRTFVPAFPSHSSLSGAKSGTPVIEYPSEPYTDNGGICLPVERGLYVMDRRKPPPPFARSCPGTGSEISAPSQVAVPIYFLLEGEKKEVESYLCTCIIADACNEARYVTDEAYQRAWSQLTEQQQSLLTAWQEQQSAWYTQYLG